MARAGGLIVDTLLTWLTAQAQSGRLPAMLGYPFIVRGLVAGAIVAPLLGGMSHLVISRRLAFLSSALGQAALTGLTIGLVLGEPINGAYGGIFGFCLLCAVLMTWVRRRSDLPADTLVGVFLALTLGLGICLLVAVTKRFNVHQIEAVLFGSLLTVTDTDLLILLGAGLAIAGLVGWAYNRLLLDGLDGSLSRAAGGDPAWLEYGFAVVLTLAIVVSLKVIGALLVEALVIVPAAAGRNLARSVRTQLAWSIAVALAGCEAGIALSSRFEVPSGGAVVLVMTALFFASLLLRRVTRSVTSTSPS